MIWLHAFVFLTGGVVLVVELLSSRLLAPAFGTTVHSWTALLSVTLAALAAGYAAGGRLADSKFRERALPLAAAGAGVWLLLLKAVSQPVLALAAPLGAVAGSLAAAAALIGPPLAALGMTVPLAVRLRTSRLGRLGRETGGVAAVSTLGGVAGALLAGFVLIPGHGVGAILAGSGLLLLALAGGAVRLANPPRTGAHLRGSE